MHYNDHRYLGKEKNVLELNGTSNILYFEYKYIYLICSLDRFYKHRKYISIISKEGLRSC